MLTLTEKAFAVDEPKRHFMGVTFCQSSFAILPMDVGLQNTM